MLKVGFAFNLNIQRCEIEVGEEKQIIDKGYKPLLELFAKYNMKANWFVSGYSSEIIEKEDKAFLDKILAAKDKVIKLGTYTYTHPIPQLLIRSEFDHQVRVGKEYDKAILKEDTKGFLPPEFAYSGEMASVLHDHDIEWIITLASQVEKSYKKAGIKDDPYQPCILDIGDGKTLQAVAAAYELPDCPARFLKLMMKGLLPVDAVIDGIKKFHEQHPDKFLLFKRDGETVFIDFFNGGFDKTYEVLDEFLSKLSALDFVQPVWIEEVIASQKEYHTIKLADFLGNTKIETFTEGAAKPIWDLTLEVREEILKAEKEKRDPSLIEKAWHHLLLSHNSDGRIGYWFSKWNPGEHEVAPSRRQFCEDNLRIALEILK
jgi:alpha-amylase/alpha-mannosidase (GH57 family)